MGITRGYTDTGTQAQDILFDVEALLTGEEWTDLGVTTIGSFDYHCWQAPSGTPSVVVLIAVASTGTGNLLFGLCEEVDVTAGQVRYVAPADWGSQWWLPANGGNNTALPIDDDQASGPNWLDLDDAFLHWETVRCNDAVLVEYVVAAGPNALAIATYGRDGNANSGASAGRFLSLVNGLADVPVVGPLSTWGAGTRVPMHPNLEPYFLNHGFGSTTNAFRYNFGNSLGQSAGTVGDSSWDQRLSMMHFGPSGLPLTIYYGHQSINLYDPDTGDYVGRVSGGTAYSTVAVHFHVVEFDTDSGVNVGDAMTVDGITYYYTGIDNRWLSSQE